MKKKKLLTKIKKEKEYWSQLTKKRKKQREPEEVRRKEQEDIERETQEQSFSHDNPKNPPPTSGEILTIGRLPISEFGLVPSTPSKQHVVVSLDKIFFDHKKKKLFGDPKRS